MCIHADRYLYVLERVAHHSDEHVDEHDEHSDVVDAKQEHAHVLHDRRRVVACGVSKTQKLTSSDCLWCEQATTSDVASTT